MTDLAQGQATMAGTAVPSTPGIRRRPGAAAAGSGRATARVVLEGALSGVALTTAERRFLARLSQWDKRSAATVAALVSSARQRGRGEASLTPDQRETMLAALADAFAYRTSGAAAAGCWNCANLASGLCADHARDAGRARAFADLAAELSGDEPHAALRRIDPVAGFRHEAAVAS